MLNRREFIGATLGPAPQWPRCESSGHRMCGARSLTVRSTPSIRTFFSGRPARSGAGNTTSSGRSNGSPAGVAGHRALRRTRSRSIGAIRGRSRKLFDDAGITLIDVSNGAKGQSTNFIDPDQIPKTIADHVAFARDFLQPFGVDALEVQYGRPAAGGPSDDQLKRLANTLNEIGRHTIAMGIRMAPHPHIWGPMEREPDVRRVMELTDPKYVWLTTDTGHLTLGGMDAVQIMSDYFPRIAEVHLKDTYAKYRGNTATPTQE